VLVNALGVLATALAALFLIPQILRLSAARDVRGVSLTWTVFGLMTNVAWIVYFTGRNLWVPAIAPALAVGTYGCLVWLIRRIETRHAWGWGALYGGALVTTMSLGGQEALGSLLALTPALQLAPAVFTAFSHPHPAGISPATWGLASAEAISWAIYGHLVGDAALVGYGAVTTFGSALVLSRCWGNSGRSRIGQGPRESSVISTSPSLMAVAAASPRLAAASFRRMFET
jgi:uncharacterized protein with PQ loop repeat